MNGRPALVRTAPSAVRALRDRRPARVSARPPGPQRERQVVVRLWMPLTPLFLLLAPFALLASPLLLVVGRARGVSPLRAALALGALLLALSGTDIAVDSRKALVRIRIF